MPTWRKYKEHWTETKFVIGGKVEITTCCCRDPGGTTNTCRLWSGNKSRCGCHCHRLRRQEDAQAFATPKSP